jgi:small subunit ribosomal protein S20
MPQHKSCEKRIRLSRKQNARNRTIKSAVKTATKRFLAAEGEDAEAAYRAVASEFDTAAKKGVIPKARANRKKSRLARELNRRSSQS